MAFLYENLCFEGHFSLIFSFSCLFSASFHVKMNKFASFYVILVFLSIEFEDYYLILQQNDNDIMVLLKNLQFKGISFEIIKEEVKEVCCEEKLFLIMRVTNNTDKKKKLAHSLNYISVSQGLKRGSVLTLNFGVYGTFLQADAFVDLEIQFDGITRVGDGDRIEFEVNDGKLASLLLLRQNGQWGIVEEKDSGNINLNLKNKVEHFESIEEQFGLTLQKFSVKIVDETSFKLFCEVLALNGEAVNHSFGVEVAVYDSDDNIVYHTSLHSNDFKGFEVYNFGTINLDIPVDEVSKIRLYPV